MLPFPVGTLWKGELRAVFTAKIAGEVSTEADVTVHCRYMFWILFRLNLVAFILNHLDSFCIHLESCGMIMNQLALLNQSWYIDIESSFIHRLNHFESSYIYLGMLPLPVAVESEG